MSGLAANYNLAYNPVLTQQKTLNVTGTFSKPKRDPDYPDYFEEVANFFPWILKEQNVYEVV